MPGQSFVQHLGALIGRLPPLDRAGVEVHHPIFRNTRPLKPAAFGADGLVIIGFPDKALIGKTLAQVARERGLSVFETVLWLARNGFPSRLGGVVWSMRAVGMVDIEEFMKQDWNSVALDRFADDLATCDPFTHPGTWGTSGRLIETFVVAGYEDACRWS